MGRIIRARQIFRTMTHDGSLACSRPRITYRKEMLCFTGALRQSQLHESKIL